MANNIRCLFFIFVFKFRFSCHKYINDMSGVGKKRYGKKCVVICYIYIYIYVCLLIHNILRKFVIGKRKKNA